MKKLEVLKFPDPRLRQKGLPVKVVTPELVSLAKNMLDLMYKEKGVGLAALQVAQPVRLLVADTSQGGEDKELRYDNSQLESSLESRIKQPLILFNPEILEQEGEVVFSEGCLSFPSYFAEVRRAKVVKVKAINENNESIEIKTDGLLSVCLQHEIDHLDGRLFIDHLSPIKASRLQEEIKKYGYPSAVKK